MDLSLSEEQEIIKNNARSFLKKECSMTFVRKLEEDDEAFSPELWKKMADLGWMGMIIPFDHGGIEGNFLDLVVLLEEMGRVCAPSWLFSTSILGAQVILRTGTEEQKEKWLPAIAAGESKGTLAMIEPQSGYDVTKIEMTYDSDGNGFSISGLKLFVPDAHIADWIICVTKGKEGKESEPTLGLFIIDGKAPGISITPLKNISAEKIFEVKFDGVKVPAENLLGGKEQNAKDLERILQEASLAKCAEMVGGAQAVLEMSADYAKQRVQFGRPIGSFQAIQHHCANMQIDLDCSRYLTYYAAWMLSEGMPCEKEIAMAKAFTSKAYTRITTLGQEIHGGTGVITEHDMQIYYRRAKAYALSLGNATFQREIIARQMGF
ncbi:MAG: acyl-CoA dehydrogenase family protein [Pseudomonadota bacterium]